MEHVMQLEFRDWENTAEHMTLGMINSGAFSMEKNPVIAIGRITNDTMQRFDTDILIKKIRATLVNSGKARIATAQQFNGKTEDEMAKVVRENRNDAEYNQATVAKTGQMIAANLSLTGKMIQRNFDLQGGLFNSRKARVEYYLQLTLTEINTGLSVWEDVKPIIKEGRRAPNW
jgi:uncharacterized protein (TIGR02722 family)